MSESPFNLKKELSSFFSGEIYDDPATLEKYSRDASLFVVKPAVVAAPKNTEDIKNLVKFAAKNKKSGISLTPRSGGTCMAGGPLSESVIVDVNKHLTRIKEVGEGD